MIDDSFVEDEISTKSPFLQEKKLTGPSGDRGKLTEKTRLIFSRLKSSLRKARSRGSKWM